MFGLSLYDKTLKVLGAEFNCFNIHPIQKPVLKGVVEQAKMLRSNEYDAAIMFMMVQLNSLADGEKDQRVESFVSEQLVNIERVIHRASNPKSDIIEMIERVKGNLGMEESADEGMARYLEGVYALVNKIASSSNIPRESDTVAKIRQEYVRVGENPASIDHLTVETILASQVHEEAWKRRKTIYIDKKFNTLQGAIFSISSLVSNLYDSGNLEELRNENYDMYVGLSLLWQACINILEEDDTGSISKAMFIPATKGIPFRELPNIGIFPNLSS